MTVFLLNYMENVLIKINGNCKTQFFIVFLIVQCYNCVLNLSTQKRNTVMMKMIMSALVSGLVFASFNPNAMADVQSRKSK